MAIDYWALASLLGAVLTIAIMVWIAIALDNTYDEQLPLIHKKEELCDGRHSAFA